MLDHSGDRFWQHARSGEVYAVRIVDGHVTAANGPLHHTDLSAGPSEVVANAYDRDLADDLDAAHDTYRLWRPERDLVSVTEIAQRAGVKPLTVHQWRRRHDDFPEPLPVAIGPIWEWPRVAEWIARPRPPGRRRTG